MADFLDEKLAEIDRRLAELRPLHEEYLRLERAQSALSGLEAREEATSRPAAAPRGPGRPAGSSQQRTPQKGPPRRRRRAGGTRAEQVLEVVRQNPGATVSELAGKLGVDQPNYLYRVMSNLQADGAVTKQDRRYFAA